MTRRCGALPPTFTRYRPEAFPPGAWHRFRAKHSLKVDPVVAAGRLSRDLAQITRDEPACRLRHPQLRMPKLRIEGVGTRCEERVNLAKDWEEFGRDSAKHV